jgi:pimeloyl-ACP methyl ester carboxylesterase
VNPTSISFMAGALLFLAGCCSVKETKAPELPPGRAFSVGGHDLFLRQVGTGPTVLLLHGLGDSSLGWQFIEPRLVQAGYHVLVWDALGAGRSEKPARADYTILAHVKRLEQTLDALGICQLVCIGHSLGGSEALLFTERNPDKVKALCLLDPAAYRAGAMGGRWFWITPLLAEAVLGILPSRTITMFGLERNFHNHSEISDELYSEYLREAERPGAVHALIAQERQLVPKDAEKWEQAHRTIRKPTLILWGEDDELVPLAQGKQLAKDIAHSSLVVFPGVGHSPHLEAPQLVVDRVLAFLKEVEAQ